MQKKSLSKLRWFEKTSVRLLFFTIILMFAGFSVVDEYITNKQKQFLLKHTKDAINSSYELTKWNLGAVVMFGDTEQLQEGIENMANTLSFVEKICIKENIAGQNELFPSHRGKMDFCYYTKEWNLKNERLPFQQDDLVFFLMAFAEGGYQTVGSLVVTLNMSELNDAIDQQVKPIQVALYIIMMLLMVAISIIVLRTMRPLGSVSSVIIPLLNKENSDANVVEMLRAIKEQNETFKDKSEVTLLLNVFSEVGDLVERLLEERQHKIDLAESKLVVKNRTLVELNKKLTVDRNRLKVYSNDLDLFQRAFFHNLKSSMRNIRFHLEEAETVFFDNTNSSTHRHGLYRAKQWADKTFDSMGEIKRAFDLGKKSRWDQFEKIDLHKLCVEVWEDVQEKERRTSNFAVEWPPEGTIVVAYRQMLTIALENLLQNAAKFSRNVANRRITVTINESKDMYVIGVLDWGCGFKMELYETLFRPFEKLHVDEGRDGFGLGLSLVKRIANRHGGDAYGLSPVVNFDGEIVAKTGLYITLKKDFFTVDTELF